jgi:hypothetical protein
MSNEDNPRGSPQLPAEYTSNDLLFRLKPRDSRGAIVVQSVDAIQDVNNAPPSAADII